MQRRYLALVAAVSSAALLLGLGCDAFEDAEPAFVPSDAGTAPPDVDPPVLDATIDEAAAPRADADADADAGRLVFVVTWDAGWSSPNGATQLVADGGVQIVGYTSFDHPVLEPKKPLALPSDDFTVLADIWAETTGEFGLVTRMGDAGAVSLGTRYGNAQTPFLSTTPSTTWNPDFATVALGPTYMLAAKRRYRLKVRTEGDTAYGKIWLAEGAEPTSWQVSQTATRTPGRRVGFYSYTAVGARLESMVVTVP